MLLAEAVSIPGEVLLLAFLVLLVAILICVSVVVGTAIAARRHARTGSRTSGVVAVLGVTLQVLVFVVAALHRQPVSMAMSGGAFLLAGVAYATAKRTRVTP